MFEEKSGGLAALLVVIVLVVLFAAFRRGGLDEGDRGRFSESPADMLAMARQANFQDPAIARLAREEAVDTGRLEHDIDDQTCQIKDEMNRLDRETNRHIAEEARRAEDRSYRAEIDRKNDELRTRDLHIAELKALHLHDKTSEHIERLRCDMDRKFLESDSLLSRRIERLDDHVLKAPPLYGFARTAAVEHCEDRRFHDRAFA